MKTYFDCWAEVAAALFSQALAGEPELAESLPKPLGAGAFGWAATLAGDVGGAVRCARSTARFWRSPLVGEGVDQKAGWKELLREAADAAAGELLARTGKKCRVVSFEEICGREQSLARLSAPLRRAGMDDSGAGRAAHARCAADARPEPLQRAAQSAATANTGASRRAALRP